jgi:hypothetical protein
MIRIKSKGLIIIRKSIKEGNRSEEEIRKEKNRKNQEKLRQLVIL